MRGERQGSTIFVPKLNVSKYYNRITMRTSQATINLVLNTQRKNKDGLCPVVLRIFWKGRKDIQTITSDSEIIRERSKLF
ncbi:MAG: hypothetical protein II449_00270 [Prevotella sp.]|nr:hypothetical protein [Prevotella sp.]